MGETRNGGEARHSTDQGVPADLPPLARYRHLIERALKHCGGTHQFEDVEQMVNEGRAVFWPLSDDSVVITEIVEHPRKRVLHIFLAAGKLEEIQNAAPFILEWGRFQRCTAASIVGRPGWKRTFLKATGWTDTGWATMTREL